MAAFFAIFLVLSCSGDADKNGGKKNAIELMKRHPMCSIEAIANECGMERVNFTAALWRNLALHHRNSKSSILTDRA